MNILLLSQVLPYPPDSGPKVKTFNVIKYLALHHSVTLVSFVRGDQSRDADKLREYCEEVYTVPIRRRRLEDGAYLLKSLVTGQPFLMLRDDRAEMRRLVSKLATERQFDIVQADQVNMAQYARLVPAPKILDAHNAIWLLYKRLAETMPSGPKRWMLERDWRLLKGYEGQICREFEAVIAVSEEDRAALQEAGGSSFDVTVIPITIDTDEAQVVKRLPIAQHILHIGTMYWPPNVDGIHWFMQEVFPLVRARRSDICSDVVGATPPADVLAYMQPGSGVNVTGYVDDPLPYMQEAGVVVVPLRAGGGMRVKILNSLAAGLPVVSTTLGAEGIRTEHGKHLLIADRPQDFANAILRLLNNPALGNELGKNGRVLIENTYDYRVACSALEQVYQAAMSKSGKHISGAIPPVKKAGLTHPSYK